jgi:hypothetical protein
MPYATPNVIPKANFDPVSLNLLNLVPKPVGSNSVNGQLSQNYQNPFLSQTRSKIPSVKGDQSIGSKHHVSFYGGATLMDAPYTATNGNAEGFPSPITGARASFIYTKTYRLNWDYTLSPTLLLHVGAGWFQQEFNDDAPATTSYDASADQPAVPAFHRDQRRSTRCGHHGYRRHEQYWTVHPGPLQRAPSFRRGQPYVGKRKSQL